MAERRPPPSNAPPTRISPDAAGAGTLSKGLDVLDLVMHSAVPPSAAAISEALQLPRPTTNRLIANLVRLGALRRDDKRRRLVEGERLKKLAMAILLRASEYGPSHELLRELARKTSETCNVGTISGGQVHYVDRIEAQWPLSLRLEPGSTVPVHCSALGKVLLGHASPERREKYLKTMTLTGYTPKTITDREQLARELEEIAKAGYSLDNEEYLTGVVGMAVPIPNGDQPPVLGLAVAAPSARVTVGELTADLPLLREVAAKLALCY